MDRIEAVTWRSSPVEHSRSSGPALRVDGACGPPPPGAAPSRPPRVPTRPWTSPNPSPRLPPSSSTSLPPISLLAGTVERRQFPLAAAPAAHAASCVVAAALALDGCSSHPTARLSVAQVDPPWHDGGHHSRLRAASWRQVAGPSRCGPSSSLGRADPRQGLFLFSMMSTFSRCASPAPPLLASLARRHRRCHTPRRTAAALVHTLHSRVRSRTAFAGSRRGAEKVPKSKVALRRSLRFPV